MLNFAVLASTRGTALQAVIDELQAGTLKNADLKCVISNKEDCGAMEKAKNAGITTYFLDPGDANREDYDKAIAEVLAKEGVELVVLVGYMKLFSPWFVKEYENKIVNIHPSLLPSFPGIDRSVHQEVLDYGCKVSGCSMFFVDEGKDTGPLILQKCTDVAEDETVDSLKAKVQALEKQWLPRVIEWIAEGKVSVEGRKVQINV